MVENIDASGTPELPSQVKRSAGNGHVDFLDLEGGGIGQNRVRLGMVVQKAVDKPGISLWKVVIGCTRERSMAPANLEESILANWVINKKPALSTGKQVAVLVAFSLSPGQA